MILKTIFMQQVLDKKPFLQALSSHSYEVAILNQFYKTLTSQKSHLQARSCGNRTLGLKSMAQVLNLTPVAQVDFNGRNLQPAPAAKPLVFSIFSFDFAFQKCFSFFAS
jgi:hypothetical protein